MSGSSRVRACNFGLQPGSGFKMRHFYNSVWVCRGQQGKIEKIHPPPTNSKYKVKSFCEVGHANFRPNVFGAGKRISMEDLVGVGLHAWCPVALKRFVTFSKNGNVQEKIFIVLVTLSDLKKTSNRAVNHTSYKMHVEVFYCKSDMHVRPMRFSILCTPTDSSDKPNCCCLLYCCACLYPNTILMEAGWTTAPCTATNLSILMCKSSARTKRD